MCTIPADSCVSESLRAYGEWAQIEINFLEKLIKPNDCVADIGAFIGTHTLAFASFVGPRGRVIAVEPRRELFELLKANTCKYNQCDNVTLKQCALGMRQESLNLSALNLDDADNFGSFSIKEADRKDACKYDVTVQTLDEFPLERLDLIKLDAENMETEILTGGANTLTRFRPLIFSECNSLAAGAPIMELATKQDYCVFGWVGNAFNPDNYRRNKVNIFGAAKETSLLLIPVEKKGSIELVQDKTLAGEIRTMDDLCLLFLHKPQYAAEVLSTASLAPTLGNRYESPLSQELCLQICNLKENIDELSRTKDLEIEKLRITVESAEKWQKSWFRRAFHRWHRPLV
jgi:FkbM family methyltransferase